MINFFSGIIFMYVLAMPLMIYISEPVEEGDHSAPLRFAFLWPLAALEVIYRMIIGDTEDDGTGTD